MGSFTFGGGYPGLYALLKSVIRLFPSCLRESTLVSGVATQSVQAQVVEQRVVVQVATQSVSHSARAIDSYSQAVLADSPAGYWRMGDAVGSGTAADSSGNGRTGTILAGGVTFGQTGALDETDTAALFDGANGTAIETLIMPAMAAWTIEAWCRTDQFWVGGFGARIIGWTDFQIDLGNRTDTLWYYAGGALWNDTGLSLAVADGYVYLALTWDGAAMRGYRNGVLGYGPSAVGRGLTNAKAYLGSPYMAQVYGNLWLGALDELAVYPSALSTTRIAEHYASRWAASYQDGTLVSCVPRHTLEFCRPAS